MRIIPRRISSGANSTCSIQSSIRKLATTPKLLGELVSRMEAMTPFIEFLNRTLVGRQSKLKRDEAFLQFLQ